MSSVVAGRPPWWLFSSSFSESSEELQLRSVEGVLSTPCQKHRQEECQGMDIPISSLPVILHVS